MIDTLELAELALAAASADEAETVVHAERSGLARFAGAEVHQPTLVDDAVIQLTVVRDGRLGVALSNRIDARGLAELARRAGEAAANANADPHLPTLAPPARLPGTAGADEETASLSAEDQARLASEAIRAAAGFDVFGFFTSGVCSLAVASTTGLRAEQRFTDATVLVLAAGKDASGFAERTSWRVRELDPAAVAREAAQKAARTRGARELGPGSYAAVLEPYALSELLRYFAWDSFNGLGLIEERSYLAGRLGERVFDEKVSIADDALDPRNLPKAFDFEGTPKRRVELVERGVARGVVWDRATAARAGDGTESTGHALQALERRLGPMPLAVAVAPGEAASAEALAELVDEGIYVTRLHYLGVIAPREGVLTGMTRDGTFRIRNGRIAEPLVNLRFTIAVPDLLADVPGLTRDVLLVNETEFYGARYATANLVPALATARFAVTGTGSRPGV